MTCRPRRHNNAQKTPGLIAGSLLSVKDNCIMKIYSAPLQGYTGPEWRALHAGMFGGVDTYCSPFLRVEKGAPRTRDHKAIALSDDAPAVLPQILFRDTDEFRILADAVIAAGHDRMDLNLGCPFPPQVKHGRGAALLRNPALLEKLSGIMREQYPNVTFSAKMRLGVERGDEWRGIIDILNDMPLSHLAVHPRVAVQQYGGELWMDEFDNLLASTSIPVIYNGDILIPADCLSIAARYPRLEGMMIGRGLLARPSLAAEIKSGSEWDEQRRLDALVDINTALLDIYSDKLCGDAQILSKIKPYWDYAEPLIGRKAAKAIRKATTMTAYTSAIAKI